MSLALADVRSWQRHAADAVEGGLPVDRTPAADAVRVDLIAALEELKNTATALQAELAVGLDASQRAQQAAAGVPAARQGGGVAAQVALARRESPHAGGIFLGLAKALHTELPHTAAALRSGALSEYRARLIAQETACLTAEHRLAVDEDLCADAATLDGVGSRRLAGLARRHAERLDPAASVRRARKAHGERCVSLRPAPDTMAYLTALVPVAQGVAAYAALTRAAETARCVGADGVLDERGRGQVMADTVIERLTGQTRAEGVSLGVNMVLSDTSLLGGGTDPALIEGYGPVPAEIARHLIATGLDDPETDTWLRRLYADPAGDLVAMTSRHRFFRDGLADFLRVRDQGICRTPWCDAPIRDGDHVTTAADGGPTSAENGQGLCQACDLAKQAPGWTQSTDPPTREARHRVTTITPTGHAYHSTAPPPPPPSRTVPTALDRIIDRLCEQLLPSDPSGG